MAALVKRFQTEPVLERFQKTGVRKDGTQWTSLARQATEYLQTEGGAKNLGAKVTKAATDWFIHFNPHCAKEVRALNGLAKDVQKGLGATEVPGAIYRVWTSGIKLFGSNEKRGEGFSVGNFYDLGLSGVKTVSPGCDAIEFLQGRVIHLSHETMETVQRVGHAALLIGMLDVGVKATLQISDAVSAMVQDTKDSNQTAANFKERGEIASTVFVLQMIELAKAVSYVALATIGLISAFFVTIPTAGFWILVCSTSALFFTLVGEFANRAFNPVFTNNPNEKTSPLSMPSFGTGTYGRVRKA